MAEKTLGGLISTILRERNMTSQKLAQDAGVSGSVISNLLQHGIQERAKEPDPRTLNAIARVLDLDVYVLFRLVGYVPAYNEMTGGYSPQALLLARLFERMTPQHQRALIGIAEELAGDAEDAAVLHTVQEEREDALFAGREDVFPEWVNGMANWMMDGVDSSTVYIEDDTEVAPGVPFKRLSTRVQEQLRALLTARKQIVYTPDKVSKRYR